MTTTQHPATATKLVGCTACGASAGTRCTTKTGAHAKQPHPARVNARALLLLNRCTSVDGCTRQRMTGTLLCAEHVLAASTDTAAAVAQAFADFAEPRDPATGLTHDEHNELYAAGERETDCPAGVVVDWRCDSCGALGHERHDGKPCTGAAGIGSCPCGTSLVETAAELSELADTAAATGSPLTALAARTAAASLMSCTGASSVTVIEERRTETAELVETARETVRRTVVELAPERVAAVLAPELIAVADAPTVLSCVRCWRTLPTSTFPTVKSGGVTYRKTECRACRSLRAAAGLRTDGAVVGTRKPQQSRTSKRDAATAATLALVAGLDLTALASSL